MDGLASQCQVHTIHAVRKANLHCFTAKVKSTQINTPSHLS